MIYSCCYLAGLIYPGKVDLQPILERGGRISNDVLSGMSTSFFDDAANRDIYAAVADLLSGLAYGFERFAGAGDNRAGRGFQGRVVVAG